MFLLMSEYYVKTGTSQGKVARNEYIGYKIYYNNTSLLLIYKATTCLVHCMAQLVPPIVLVMILWTTSYTHDTPCSLFLSLVLCLGYESLWLACIFAHVVKPVTQPYIIMRYLCYKWVMLSWLTLYATSF
jgi:hypothetical protein